jgi:hypothetical protein
MRLSAYVVATIVIATLIPVSVCPLAAVVNHDIALRFSGFHFETGPGGSSDPTPAEFFGEGDHVVLVGHVTEFMPDFLPYVDFDANEYTVVISGGYVVGRREFAGFINAPLQGNLRVRVYEDPKSGGTPGTFTLNPPNDDTPGRFEDGALVLGGAMEHGVFVWNPSTAIGYLNTFMEYDEGSLLPYLVLRHGDAFAMDVWFRLDPPPPGYGMAATGESTSIWIDPVETQTWGQLKGRYR